MRTQTLSVSVCLPLGLDIAQPIFQEGRSADIVGMCRMSDKKRAKKALPALLSLVNSFLEGKELEKAAKALRKGLETEVRYMS